MKDEKDICYSWQRSSSEKLVFGFSESCICDGSLLNYKMCLFTIFFLRSNIYRKKLTSFLSEKKCADLRDHYNNMELKVFCKVLFLVRFFFFRFGLLIIKTKFEIIMVTFHPKLSADEIFDVTDEETWS